MGAKKGSRLFLMQIAFCNIYSGQGNSKCRNEEMAKTGSQTQMMQRTHTAAVAERENIFGK